jgi:uncharacterized protein (DUF433 family)
MAQNRDVYANRIVVDPEILLGKPVIKGTRISVELILSKLGFAFDIDELLDDYPRLTTDDIRACLAYAADVIASEEIHLVRRDDALATA